MLTRIISKVTILKGRKVLEINPKHLQKIDSIILKFDMFDKYVHNLAIY